ncbi:MAG: hypothetical protein QXG65_06690 [Thermoplasmata archaeon]
MTDRDDARAARALDRRGSAWLRAGGLCGAIGAAAALFVPTLLLALARAMPGGPFPIGGDLLRATGGSVLAGSALLLVSFVCYRWSYSLYRKVDARFWVPSALCLVGSSGLLLLLIGSAAVVGSADALVPCAEGSWGQALHCLGSVSPLGAYAGILGLWLGWIGGVGIVLGLGLRAGIRASAALAVAGALYGVLLVLLGGPAIGLVLPIPAVAWLWLGVPAFAVAAPVLVALAPLPPPVRA